MTSSLATMSLAIGASAAGAVGRSARWGAEQFLRSPMAASGLIVASGLTLIAATNALYFQDARHPAPLFVSDVRDAQPAQLQPIAPVVVEPQTVPERPDGEAPASPAQAGASTPASFEAAQPTDPAAPSIGNQDIADLQEKLKAMGFFDGLVDGYYGPKTADAIRAFEARFNLPRTGAATPQVLDAVRQAPLSSSQASVPTSPSARQPQPAPSAEAEPLIAQMQRESAAPVTPEQRVVAEIAAEAAPIVAAVQVDQAATPPALDQDLVSDIQRGLSRLGFLQGPVNGIADESTARAIRKFQIFNNFTPTGEVSQTLRDMLVAAGAYL